MDISSLLIANRRRLKALRLIISVSLLKQAHSAGFAEYGQPPSGDFLNFVAGGFQRPAALGAALMLLLAACGQAAEPTPTPSPLPTLVASLTSTPAVTAEQVVETPAAETTPGLHTETPQVITVEPLLGQAVTPPLDITLPDGWAEQMNDTLLLPDVDAMRPVPFVVWSGPVTGGTGRILLLWGFASMVGGNPLEAQVETPAPDAWADGLRLLRLAVKEPGCNIGTDLRRDYRVGLLPAVGTQFSAVDCPEAPDTRGWFAGLNEGGLNFVFFVFTDPIDAMTAADEELQAILDTVRFDVPEL